MKHYPTNTRTYRMGNNIIMSSFEAKPVNKMFIFCLAAGLFALFIGVYNSI